MIAPRFLLQSYGEQLDHVVQTRYAILSILAYAPHGIIPEIVLYTDREEAFLDLRKWVELRLLTPHQIAEWQGPYRFVHRLKLLLLLHDLDRGEPIPRVYLDSDTFFVQSWGTLLTHIGEKEAVMHKREYHIGTHGSGQMKRFRRRIRPLRYKDRALPVDIWMWNAGVIGFMPGHRPLLEEALAIVDTIYPRIPKHYIEQYAVSLLFQEHLSLHEASPWITHYWNAKPFYTHAIQQFFERNTSLESQIAALKTHPLSSPPEKRRKGLWGWLIRKRFS